MNERTNKQLNEQTNKQTNKQINEQMNGHFFEFVTHHMHTTFWTLCPRTATAPVAVLALPLSTTLSVGSLPTYTIV